MSTTLTNGLKLPDKGSVDWYSDMQNNYTILDGAVGTIAEHTTALAGKAPAVHTHTKSDITDFPAYGTTAGTICEGNDSRLSDARTPTAHTHVKADITDLLNSNFIPSANNSYDLGSSSYQWNNVYSKNYYYNGTAWGLDKANVWNTYQTINGHYFGNEQSPNGRTCLYLTSNRDTVGQSGIYITKFRQNRGQGGLQPLDLHYLAIDILENSVRTNGVLNLNITGWNNDVPNGAVLYSTFADAQLGSSLAPWKSINGVNPGALSLPGSNSGINTDNWDKTGATANSYTPAVDGWLVLRCADVAGDYLFATWSGGAMRTSVTGQGLITVPTAGLCLYIPVKAGTTVDCVVKATNKFGAYIYPCLGNV